MILSLHVTTCLFSLQKFEGENHEGPDFLLGERKDESQE